MSLKVNGVFSAVIFLTIFIVYLFLDGCQEGMQLWIKTDLVIFLASNVNYLTHFYFETARIVVGMNEKEKMNKERLLNDG
jgi:hypothetical protein